MTVSRSTSLRRGLGAVLALGVAISLAACGGSGAGSNSARSTLTFGESSDAAPTGYDPLLYSGGQSTFFAGLYDSLFVTDKTGATQPSLVSSATTSDDKLSLTLKLRDGVTFMDGSKLDSALVKSNLDRRSDKTLNPSYGAFATGGAAEISSIDVPDTSTVVINWKSPQASGQDRLVDESGMIVGAKAIADPTTLKTKPDGSGPYTLDTTKTTRGSKYTLTKNSKAWNAKSFAFDSVVFKVITSPQALANAVVSGQVDVAGALGEATVSLVQSKQKVTQNGGTIVGFPVVDKLGVTNPAFGKVEVRQALNYAIDRAALVKSLHPTAKATAQLFPSEAVGFDAALNTKYAHNQTKAKELLAAAGYPQGFSIDLVVLGQATDDEIAVQKQWAEVGVTLNFKVVSSTDALFASVSTTPLLFGPFAVGTQPAGFVAGVLYGGFMNQQKASDPAIGGALGGALGASGDAQKSALTALNAAITDEGWYLPLYESFISYGYNASKVAEPVYSGTNGYLLLSDIKPAK